MDLVCLEKEEIERVKKKIKPSLDTTFDLSLTYHTFSSFSRKLMKFRRRGKGSLKN